MRRRESVLLSQLAGTGRWRRNTRKRTPYMWRWFNQCHHTLKYTRSAALGLIVSGLIEGREPISILDNDVSFFIINFIRFFFPKEGGKRWNETHKHERQRHNFHCFKLRDMYELKKKKFCACNSTINFWCGTCVGTVKSPLKEQKSFDEMETKIKLEQTYCI